MTASPVPPLGVSDLLACVTDLLTPESARTQGVNARDAQGLSILPLDDRAVAWCLLGAVRRCTGDTWPNAPGLYRTALALLATAGATLMDGHDFPGGPISALVYNTYAISHFNDRSPHAQVLTACRDAQAQAKGHKGEAS